MSLNGPLANSWTSGAKRAGMWAWPRWRRTTLPFLLSTSALSLEHHRNDRPGDCGALWAPRVPLQALFGGSRRSAEDARLGEPPPRAGRDAFDLYILWLGGHAQPGRGGTLAPAERERAAETLLGFTYADYAGQVLAYLEPAEQDRFAGEERWAEVVAWAFALVEAAPTGHSGAAR